MKKVLFYHIYLTENSVAWASIFLEQFKAMEDSGLLCYLDQIQITCVSRNDHNRQLFNSMFTGSVGWATPSRIQVVIDHVENPFSTDAEMLANIDDERAVTENYTMRKIYNYAWNVTDRNSKVLYVHAKGITTYTRLLEQGKTDEFRKYYYWRQFLNWGVINKWRDCVEELDRNSVVGVNYQSEPSPHFSGGFWWANTEHIVELPDPEQINWWTELQRASGDEWMKGCSNRFRDEMWVCYPLIERKVCDLVNLPASSNPARVYLPSTVYDRERH